jgi:hypothetical protein
VRNPRGSRFPTAKKSRVIDQLGTPTLVVIAANLAVSLWAWLAYVLTAPRDFLVFVITLMVATTIASAVQISLVALTPVLRDARGRLASFAVQFASTLLLGAVVLAITPPGTPADDFIRGGSIYQVIGVSLLLSLVSVYLGAAVFYLVLLPLSLLLRAISGRKARSAVGGNDSTFEQMSRAELAATGGILLATLGFGISMYFVFPDAGQTVTRLRMLDQLGALITFRGNLTASASALFCVVVIVVLVIVNNVAVRNRRRRKTPTP